MADKASIAAKRIRATRRINDAIRALAEKQEREYPPLPTVGRDHNLIHANQLTVLADILEDIAKGGE